MYSHYWSLDRPPFENTLDPAFFFPSQTHQAALWKLRYLIENRKGAGVLVGPTGSGKTMVVHRLAEELEKDVGPWIHVVFPQMSADDLLSYLAVQLGGDAVDERHLPLSRSVSLRMIEQAFVELTRQGRHAVIVVDDAHLIDDPETLQALELLLNFQQTARSEFSLILLGDRLLLSRLTRMPRFDERLIARSMLQSLSQDEVARYIRFRLEVSGARSSMFDGASLDEIAALSGGSPRRVNRLADLALLVGYADNRMSLTADDVTAVNEELSMVGVD